MTLLRVLLPLIFLVSFAGLSAAQDTSGDASVLQPGQQSLEDIMARQRGEDVPFGAELPLPLEGNPPPAESHLGPLGSASDADLWREIRADALPDARASNRGPAAKVLMQDGGLGGTGLLDEDRVLVEMDLCRVEDSAGDAREG